MLILIHGQDTFSSRQYLDKIVEQFKTKHSAAGGVVDVIRGEDAEWENIATVLTANGLFSSKKLVLLKNVLDKKEIREALQTYLENKALPADTTLVVYHNNTADKRLGLVKKLSAEKFSREFMAPDEAAVRRFIMERLKAAGRRMDSQALGLLMSSVGLDLERAATEIEKLAHLGSLIITAVDIKSVSQTSLEDDIWQFIDTVVAGSRARALALLEQQFLAGAEPLYLLAMLIRQTRMLLALKDAVGSDSELGARLDMHPFAVKKTRQHLRLFSPAKLVGMYQALVRLDTAFKTGHGEPKLLFTILVDAIAR